MALSKLYLCTVTVALLYGNQQCVSYINTQLIVLKGAWSRFELINTFLFLMSKIPPIEVSQILLAYVKLYDRNRAYVYNSVCWKQGSWHVFTYGFLYTC